MAVCSVRWRLATACEYKGRLRGSNWWKSRAIAITAPSATSSDGAAVCVSAATHLASPATRKDASAMDVWLSLWRGAVGRPAQADASAMVVWLSLWRGAVGRPAPADASAMVVRLSLWRALILSLTCVASAFAAGGAKANKSAQPRRGATKTTPSRATVKSAAPKTAAPKTAAAKAAATVIPATVAEPPQAGTKAYKLRYKFKPGETVRWEVEHRAKVRTTVSAPAPSGAPPADVVASSTQTAETLSTSIKVWKVIS